MNFEKAQSLQMLFKNWETCAACCEIIKAGLTELDRNVTFFGPDNIPDGIKFDQGITGSAVNILSKAGLIVDCWRHDPENGIVHGRRRSLRKSANGRKVQLYSIASVSLARAFLRRHGQAYPDRQGRLAL